MNLFINIILPDDDFASSSPDVDNYPSYIVKYTLQAMRYNSIEAMQRFPRLLQLVEDYPDVMNIMIKEVRDYPM